MKNDASVNFLNDPQEGRLKLKSEMFWWWVGKRKHTCADSTEV